MMIPDRKLGHQTGESVALVRDLGLQPYEPVYAAMRAATDARVSGSNDEIWLLEHEPVFTLGMNGKPEHVLDPGAIPLIRVDRGGQVTYHGPGQLVVYLLTELRQRGLGIRSLVTLIEESIIELLAGWNIAARARPEAPGVYLGERKIASLGLRVCRGYAYHGLALNVAMDLQPFGRINPCGYPGLQVTQVAELVRGVAVQDCATGLLRILSARLGYTGHLWLHSLPCRDAEQEQSASQAIPGKQNA